MGQTYNKYEFSNRIVLFAVITMFFSLIICIIHVYDVRNTYLEQYQNSYFQQVFAANYSMQSQFKHISTNVDEMSEHIISNHQQLTEEEIRHIITTYEDVTDYAYISFTDRDGNLYHTGENPIAVSRQYELNKTEDEKIVYGDIVYEDQEVNTYVSLEKDVWQAGHYLGKLMCYYDTTELFSDYTFEFISENGLCYITDFQNLILPMSEYSRQFMGRKSPFIGIFQESFGASDESVDFYHDLYAEIDQRKNGVKYISAEDGREYIFSYQFLDDTSNTYLITYYDAEVFLDEVNDVVFRSSITCILIICLMLILIMFVWLSSMKTTSLVEKMAYEDPITKGKNLNYFKVKSLEILKTYRAFSYIVERFDIANFRYINEAYGHDRADVLLKGCLRLADEIFLESELCARMDSDQFVLLSVNDSSSDLRWANYKQSVNEYARTIVI